MIEPAAVRVPRHVPLVQVVRGDVVEGYHCGSVVMLAADGTVELAVGDGEAACYPRSALKPVQAVGMLRSGLPLTGKLLALSAASHAGEHFHIAGVRRILELGELGEQKLRNPPELPSDPAARAAWLAHGQPASRLTSACSGKHAAMLLTCACRRWSVDTYLDRDHRLQQAIAATVAELAGESIARVSTDGCGAPLFSISLLGLTRAVARIATASPDSPEGRVATAFREFPEMVAGRRRDTSMLMRAVPGLIAKDGVEGVQVTALPDGRAIGVKIADGAERPLLPVTAAALARWGIEPSTLVKFASRPLFGGGSVVGRLEVVGPLRAPAESLAVQRVADLAAATRP